MTALPTTVEHAVPANVLARDYAMRDKVTLWIAPDGPKRVEVTLSGQFDNKSPDERKACNLLGHSDFDFRYSADLDLAAERQALMDNFQNLYDPNSRIGTLLRQENLQKLSGLQLRTALMPFARQGWNVFNHLFCLLNDLQGVTAKRVPIVRNALVSLVRRPQVITVHSNVPLFPWNFLYSDAPNEAKISSLELGRFWGFHHEVQQRLKGTSDSIVLRSESRVVAAICSATDKGRHDEDDHPFRKFSAQVRRIQSCAELATLLRAFDHECLYFYGHANHKRPPVQSESWLSLCEIKLYVSSLLPPDHPQFLNELVVAFLNGCRMAQLDDWDDKTIIGYLCHCSGNRLCCVAPVAEVPESFAADFAEHVWTRFLIERKPIGTALVDARNATLNEWNNPLGLLYSLFGRVDTHIPAVTESR